MINEKVLFVNTELYIKNLKEGKFVEINSMGKDNTETVKIWIKAILDSYNLECTKDEIDGVNKAFDKINAQIKYILLQNVGTDKYIVCLSTKSTNILAEKNPITAYMLNMARLKWIKKETLWDEETTTILTKRNNSRKIMRKNSGLIMTICNKKDNKERYYDSEANRYVKKQ